MAQAQVIATVSSLAGEAFARNSAGDIRRLKVGEAIREGETVVAASGAHVVLMLADGREMTVDSGETARLDAEVGAPVKPDAKDSAIANDGTDFQKIAQALGAGSEFESLIEDPVAGSAGVKGNEGHTFLEFLRVVETVAPLSYQFGTFRAKPLDTIEGGIVLNPAGSAIEVNAPDQTPDSTPLIAGATTALAGSTVTVTVTDAAGSSQVLVTTVQPGGTYSVVPGTPLVGGPYKVTASVDDPAGGRVTTTEFGSVATTAAAGITVTAIATDNIVNAAEGASATVPVTGTVSGDAQVGDTVTLVVNGHNYTGTVQSGNTYSINVLGSDLLADPDKKVDASVTATDAAGNSITATAQRTYVVDTGLPNAAIDLANTSASDTGVSNTDNVTANARPVISGLGEPNATVVVTVDPDNNPATANSITYGATTDGLGNWSVDLVTATPMAGALPPAGLPEGTVGLTVASSDAAGNSGTASNTFVVDSSGPVLTSAPVSGLEDGAAIKVTLSATDANAVGSFALVSLPANGTLYLDATLTQPALVGTDYAAAGGQLALYFKPAADWNGSTGFDYAARDVAGNLSSAGPVLINVSAVADIADDTAVTGEDTPVNIDVNANDSFENAGHAITAINGTAIVVGGSVAVANGSVTLKADGTLDFTPTANANGSSSFTYTVTSGGVTETATVNLTVNAVNDAPTVAGATLAGTEDTPLPLAWASFGVSDIDSADASLSVTITALPASGVLQHFDGSSWTAVTVGSNYTYADISAGNLRFMPASNQSGTAGYAAGLGNMKADYARFDYTASDGSLGSASGTVTVDIAPVTDTPSLSLATGSFLRSSTFEELTAKSGPNAWTRNVTDIGDGAWRTGNAGGTVESYWEGEYLQNGNVSNRVLELETNTGAVANLYTDVSTRAGQVYHLSLDFAERLNNQNLGSYGLIPAYGSSQVDVYWGGVKVATLNTDSGTWTHFELNLAATTTGTTRLSFQATDSNSVGGILDNLSLQLSPNTALINTATPLPQPTAALADADGSETLAVSIANLPVGAVLSDGTHSFTATAGSQVATITGWNYAALTMAPPTGYTGSIVLDYTATATETLTGASATTVTPVTINVIAANTAPVALADSVSAVRDVVIHGNVLGNDADANGDTLYVTGFTINGTAYATYDSVGLSDNTTDSVTIAGVGYFRMLADGSYSLTPLAGYTGTVPAISYTVADEHGGYSTATLSLSVATTGGIVGAAGADSLAGTAGDDIVSASAGDDTLNGLAGHDVLDGGAGNDILVGGDSADLLWGRAGNDTLTGGTGSATDPSSNTFAWAFGDQGTVAVPAVDTITDFNQAPVAAGGDVLDLRDLLVGEIHNSAQPVGNLDKYLHFTMSAGTTTIEVKSHGVATSSTDQKIVLSGVDLTNSGALATDQAIIQDILSKGKLVVD